MAGGGNGQCRVWGESVELTYTVHHGDCLEVLPKLAANSVDAVIADPPYGTTACKWDSVIPLAPMWAELKRVIKPHGAIVMFAAQPFTSALVMSNAEWFRHSWVWSKPMGTNYLNANRDPLKSHEDIITFADGYPTYNPQKRKGTAYRATSGAVGDFIRDKSVGGWVTISSDRYPLSVIHFNQVQDNEHPTQKPVDLLRYLVRTYTNPGETVLDFTMGSGTTGVACVMEERKFIGIELDVAYYQIAQRRIAEAAAQPRLILDTPMANVAPAMPELFAMAAD